MTIPTGLPGPYPGLDAAASQRVMALEAITRSYDARMSELPTYNDRLDVEATGFRLVGPAGSARDLLGTLITPWSIDIVMLALEEDTYDHARIGKTQALPFPAGVRVFNWVGEPAVGMFRVMPVKSPCLDVLHQDEARTLGATSLSILLTMADTPSAAAPLTSSASPPAPRAVGRRELFLGRLGRR